MRRVNYPLIFSLILLAWSMVTFRVEVLLFTVLIIIISFFERSGLTFKSSLVLFCLGISVAFSPIKLTLQNVDGSPKLVGYCNIRDLDSGEINMDKAYQAQAAGNCFVASDLATSFAPKKFLVW